MEDDAEGEALASAQARDAVAHGGAVPAARALHRPLVDGEDDCVALAERYDLAARLHARPLLDQHELAAVELPRRVAQQDGGLQREDQLAVKVAVQAVVVARAVAQQQWRRPLLAAGVALAEPA